MGDVPKAWLSFGEKWDFFQATKSGESNCWSSEMLAEVKMWTLSKILPTHLFHDPPLYCTWIIIFTLICLPHLLDIGVEKHKLTNSEPQNQKPPVHRGSFHETYLRWTVVLVAPLFGVIAAACSTGRMGTHTTMVTGHIQEPLKLGLLPSQGNQIVFQFFHVFRGKFVVRFTDWSINRCQENVLQTVGRPLHQLRNRPSCLAEVFVQAAWMKGQWGSPS